MVTPDPIERLADHVGIETGYEDARGKPRKLSRESIEALLAVLGVTAAGDDAARAAIADLEDRAWRRPLPPVHVARQGEPVGIAVVVPARAKGALSWTVTTEDGAAHSGTAALDALPVLDSRGRKGRRLERRGLTLTADLPLGYHRLRVATGRGRRRGETTLIIVPRRCYLPPALDRAGRTWGFSVQLYGLCSERNWGIGDLTDLAKLVEGAHALGAGVVGVNPLHAGFLATPDRASPYEPTSRLFLNVLYLDVERVPDFAECGAAQRLAASPAFQRRLAALRAAPLVDYAGVARCKREVLELLYRSFAERHLGGDALSERGAAFRRFQREGGPPLRAHATFDALAERFAGAQDAVGSWQDWPEPFRDPDGPAVRDFAEKARERIEFHEYLQWLAAGQLAEVGARCETLGLDVGLYLDLAVGVGRDGADVWADREAYVAAATVGAPPDIWNPGGQDWGLPPLHPGVMRERAYAPFAAVLRANMRTAGALRIDHVLGLLHLWWIPRGRAPGDGGFVRYPFEDLLGIVALESHRNRCLVVGEDLGTVPEGLKRRLQEAGVLSYRLLYFEQDAARRFLPPAAYPRLALATVTTHDLPTLAGYWAAHDLKLRRRLKLFPTRRHEREAYAARAHDRAALIEALRGAGLWAASGDEPPTVSPELVAAAHVFLARSPAMILMAQFEDMLGLMDQPNLPGTRDEHPNWRRKLPATLSALLADRRVLGLAGRIRAARRRPAKPW